MTEIELIQDIINELRKLSESKNPKGLVLTFKELQDVKKSVYSKEAITEIRRIIKRRNIFSLHGSDGFTLSNLGEKLRIDFEWNYQDYLDSFIPTEKSKPIIKDEQRMDRIIIQEVLDEYMERGLPRGFSLFFLNYEDLRIAKLNGITAIKSIIQRCDIFKPFEEKGFELSWKGEILRDIYNWDYQLFASAHDDNEKQKENEEFWDDIEGVFEPFESAGGNVFLVDSEWQGDDKTNLFLDESTWINYGQGSDSEQIKTIKTNDLIILKSIVESNNEPALRIKAIGRVIGNPMNGNNLNVLWVSKVMIDFSGHFSNHSGTILLLNRIEYFQIFSKLDPDTFSDSSLLIGQIDNFLDKHYNKNDNKEIESNENKSNDIRGKVFRHRDKRDIEPTIGVKEIANKLADQIRNLKDEEGQMIGIFGRWGRGKTYLISQVCDRLGVDYHNNKKKKDELSEYHLVKIHAWKYKEVNALWAYLYETCADQYYKSSKYWLGPYWKRLILNKRRIGGLKFWKLVISVFISLGWWLIPFEYKVSVFAFLGRVEINELNNSKDLLIAIVNLTPFFISAALFLKNVLPKASMLYSTLAKKHSFRNELGFQAKVQEELKTLFGVWVNCKNSEINKRILIVVDDLDRCELKNILPIADALRVILEDSEIIKRVIIITLVDELILMEAIRMKYSSIYKSNSTIIREYMDKLFITGLKLPDLSNVEREKILNSITKGEVFSRPNKLSDELVLDPTKSYSDLDIEQARMPEEDDENSEVQESTEPNISGSISREKEKFLITSDEKNLIAFYIRDLNGPTPRQIKVFYYRYLFLKLLDSMPQNNFTKQLGATQFHEYCLYRLVVNHNRTLENHITTKTEDQKIYEILGTGLSDGNKIKLNTLFEMVVLY